MTVLARLRAIVAGSRKALLIYCAVVLIVALQVVSMSGSLIRCANNPACSWLDFIAIVQKAVENVTLVIAAAGTLLPALMALEDAFAKLGLPPAGATSLQVSTTTAPATAGTAGASSSVVTATTCSACGQAMPEAKSELFVAPE